MMKWSRNRWKGVRPSRIIRLSPTTMIATSDLSSGKPETFSPFSTFLSAVTAWERNKLIFLTRPPKIAFLARSFFRHHLFSFRNLLTFSCRLFNLVINLVTNLVKRNFFTQVMEEKYSSNGRNVLKSVTVYPKTLSHFVWLTCACMAVPRICFSASIQLH